MLLSQDLISFIDDHRIVVDKAFEELHRIPELGGQEYKTTSLISDFLKKNDIEVIDSGLQTGIIGIIKGATPGPTIALRADIDALPIHEDESHALLSQHSGIMHACGHDGHTASLLGAALALNHFRNKLQGNVILIFQPEEEPVTGARKVIETGLFEKHSVKYVIGQHVRPDIPVGSVGVKNGAIMAAKDSFEIIVNGLGGHGASPESTVDPIVAASALVMAIQTIVGRNISPRESVVVSVCTVVAEGSTNIIPNTVRILGSIRSCSKLARSCAKNRLEEITQYVLKGYGCSSSLTFIEDIPVNENSSEMFATARQSAIEVFGEEQTVCPDTSMVSEDFALYSAFAPTFFFFLGSGIEGHSNAPLHSSELVLSPDTPILGAKLLCVSALNFLQQ